MMNDKYNKVIKKGREVGVMREGRSLGAYQSKEGSKMLGGQFRSISR